MPPRVTYWTGTWDPEKEAISKEVNALRVGSRVRAPVVSFAPGQASRLVRRDRVLMLAGGAWLALRAAAALVERRGDVTHIFGGQSSWHLLRALGRRPILITAVVPSLTAARVTQANIARVAVEAEGGIDDWIKHGVALERIEIVRPGIDLEWYAASAAPDHDRFTLLFASSPSSLTEIPSRGIPLLVELARLRSDIDVDVPWRNWGDVAAAQRAIAELRPPANFRVTFDGVQDMRPHYAAAHATIVCFERGTGKTCPNFVIEGLAAGRPCVATPDIGLAADLLRAHAGVVAARNVGALAAAIDELQADWSGFSRRARQLAEEQFGLARFVASYERLYGDIASGGAS